MFGFKRLGDNVIQAFSGLSTNDTHEIHSESHGKGGIVGEVVMGYDPYIDSNGVTQLGEVKFKRKNLVAVGGANYLLTKILGVEPDLSIAPLNELYGVIPDAAPDVIYPPLSEKHRVCLFGVGVGGCGVGYSDIVAPKSQNRELYNMVPMRVVDAPFESAADKSTYSFRKVMEDGKHAYYLKSFKAEPSIRNLWKDASSPDEDGTPVEDNVHESTKRVPIESFGEIVLEINKRDIREYFELYGDTKDARFNELSLFSGMPVKLPDGTEEFADVRLFSHLTFSNEMLHMNKNLVIIYRLYVS